MRRFVSGILLLLLFAGLFSSVSVFHVKALGTIYIRADGSVDPPAAPLSTIDNVTYTFTDNIYDSIVVERGNILIDGNGYTLQGNGTGNGFYWTGINNVTIKNTNVNWFRYGIWLNSSSYNVIFRNNITANESYAVHFELSSNNTVSENNITNNYIGFSFRNSSDTTFSGNNITANRYGVYLIFSSNNTVFGNNITANNYYGVYLTFSSNNTVSENNINSNKRGIYLHDQSNNNTVTGNNITANTNEGMTLIRNSTLNTISGNNITDNDIGIKLAEFSTNNILRNNSMAGSACNFWVEGTTHLDFINDVDASNTVDGKPIYYWIHEHDRVVPLDGGYVALVNCTNITVQNLTLANNGQGVLLVYTTNSTITGNSITDNFHGIHLYASSNATIFGNYIAANEDEGIHLRESTNNNISRNSITNSSNNGIYIYISSNNNIISKNNITTNTNVGLLLQSSNNNTVSGNSITDNDNYGMKLWGGRYNSVVGNNITDNEYGLDLYVSPNNTLRSNSIADNRYNFQIAGVGEAPNWANDVDASNTVDGKPIYYWIHEHDRVVPLDGGYVALVNCTNITVQNLTLANNGQGVLLVYTTNSTITGNNITNNYQGTYLTESLGNTISANSIANNDNNGISLRNSSFNNTISGNNVTANKKHGIVLYKIYYTTISGNYIGYNYMDGVWLTDSSHRNVISGNNITNNYDNGIRFFSLQRVCNYNTISGNHIMDNRWDGIEIWGRYNNISENHITNNHHGIGLHTLRARNNVFDNNITANGYGVYFLGSSNNTVFGNNITANYYGVLFHGDSNVDNSIYHNNFVDNIGQVDSSFPTINIWDDGYPSGGNYWSDYAGNDTRYGVHQNLTGRDRIGDTPYFIDEYNEDNYPLIDPWTGIDVYVTEVELKEESWLNSTLFETIVVSNSTMQNATISNDLNGYLNFTTLVSFKIETGSFAGQGGIKGNWTAKISNTTYTGTWKATQFFNSSKRSFNLKGSVSGDLRGICEGSITESAPESNIYDQYHSLWRLNHVGTSYISASIEVEGIITGQNSSTFPSTKLYSYQAAMNGSAAGYYTGSLNAFLTHLRVADANSSLDGEGFSAISYTSPSGLGEGWTYDRLTSPDSVGMNGQFTDPLLGVVSGTLDEATSPRTLSLTIERVDLGPWPMVNLKVKTWTSSLVRPGRTIDFFIKYRNDGLNPTNITVIDHLPADVEYISNSGEGIYNNVTHDVTWHFENVLRGGEGRLSVKCAIPQELTLGTQLVNIVSLPKEKIEVEVDPTVHVTPEILEDTEDFTRMVSYISNQTDTVPSFLNISLGDVVTEKPEHTYDVINTSVGMKIVWKFPVEANSSVLREASQEVSDSWIPVEVSQEICDVGLDMLEIHEDFREVNEATKKYQAFLDWCLGQGYMTLQDHAEQRKLAESRSPFKLIADSISWALGKVPKIGLIISGAFQSSQELTEGMVFGVNDDLLWERMRNFSPNLLNDITNGPLPPSVDARGLEGLWEYYLNKVSHDVSSSITRVVSSVSPEDKYGPIGFDAPNTPPEECRRYIPANQTICYLVDFWNMANASVPTQEVFIEDQLDSNLNWSSFRFEEFGFLDYVVSLEQWQEYFGPHYFNINVDMRPEMDLIVNVEGNFSVETGEIWWVFRSLDPETMELPEDPMAGFLPPITENGSEVGWVCFEVTPTNGLPNGTQIENQAFVNFDGVGPYNPAPKEGPYINTIATRNIAVTDVVTQKTIVGEDQHCTINATILNGGTFNETFNVTLYANTTSIETQQVIALPNGTATTLTFTWNVTGFANGNYTIRVTADSLADETSTADNTHVNGWIVVTLPGDVDGDTDVDIFDIVQMAGAYGTCVGDPWYDPNCDIDGDGCITNFDIVIAAGSYGESW